MKQISMRKAWLVAAAGAMAITGLAGTAYAQRDPAYAEARASGKVGEKMDGYLGIVGTPTPELQRLVNDINIKRKAVYSEKARQAGATIEEYALTAGCIAISKTVPPEMYQGPRGEWLERTNAPPQRDSRCPA